MRFRNLIAPFLRILPDQIYIRIQYRYLTGRTLKMNPPIRFNEKLQWIKLYDRRPEYTDMVDKYKVKEYVASKIGEKYVIPLLGVWDNPEQIDFSSLPQQFVLKTNHDSKGVVICKNKAEFDIDKAKEFLKRHMKSNAFYYGREWPYKNIVRKVIAECYLEDNSGGLQDYKVMCFNGAPKLIQLHKGRFSEKYTQDIYDTKWKLQPFNQVGETGSDYPAEKPPFLEEMLKLSSLLASNIPHVRVDWYFANGQLYFGELTFFDASGYLDFIPDNFNEKIGSWIHLPLDK